ncbi:hypothetical protein [Streptomyces sp. NRRL WC-3744]|nr:hypothetical protein [Streptomyces sp. NRRL WC-3744]
MSESRKGLLLFRGLLKRRMTEALSHEHRVPADISPYAPRHLGSVVK